MSTINFEGGSPIEVMLQKTPEAIAEGAGVMVYLTVFAERNPTQCRDVEIYLRKEHAESLAVDLVAALKKLAS